MTEKKTELVSLRATPSFKRALKFAAEDEKRSQANFLEKLVMDYCSQRGIDVAAASEGMAPKARASRKSRKQR